MNIGKTGNKHRYTIRTTVFANQTAFTGGMTGSVLKVTPYRYEIGW